MFEEYSVNKGWALILPDSDEPVCQVYSKRYNEEYAKQLYEKRIKQIQERAMKIRLHTALRPAI